MTSDPEVVVHRDLSFWIKWILLLLGLIFLGSMIAAMITQVISDQTNTVIGVFNFNDLNDDQLDRLAWIYRVVIFCQHLFAFILPAIVTMLLFKKRVGHSVFLFAPTVNWNATILGIFILMCAYPLVQFSSELNKLIPLPDVLHNMEEQTAELVKLMLGSDSFWILAVNVFLIALVPAIGEELIFRGFLQTILGQFMRNKHIIVWTTAIIFSAIHMQFEGFFPRMILGLVLGYLMLWSGNIFYPMIAHFVNNAVQVILQYFVRNDQSKLDEMDNYSVPIWLVFTSVVLLMLTTAMFQSYFKKNKMQS
jgi:uncharacterized protein